MANSSKIIASLLGLAICWGLGSLLGGLWEGNDIFVPDNPLYDSGFGFDVAGIGLAVGGFLGAVCGFIVLIPVWLGKSDDAWLRRSDATDKSAGARSESGRINVSWKTFIKVECIILAIMTIYASVWCAVEYRVARQPQAMSSLTDVGDEFIDSGLLQDATFVAGWDQTTDQRYKYELVCQISRANLHQFIIHSNISLDSGAKAASAKRDLTVSLFGNRFTQWRVAGVQNYRIGTMDGQEVGYKVHRTVLLDLDVPKYVTLYIRFIFNIPTQPDDGFDWAGVGMTMVGLIVYVILAAMALYAAIRRVVDYRSKRRGSG